MKNSAECEVSKVLLEQAINAEYFTDEKIFRRLATDLVNKMPFDEFRLLFNLEKVDEKSIEKFMQRRMPTNTEMMLLHDLRIRHVVKYAINIESPDIINSYNSCGCPNCGYTTDNPRTELWRTKVEFKEEPNSHYEWEEVHKCFKCETIYKFKQQNLK